MTPAPKNWADAAVKALRIIRDAKYYPPNDVKHRDACRGAFDEGTDITDQILLAFKIKKNGSGLKKLFDALNETLKVYSKYTSKPESAKRLVDAYKDAFFAWRKVLKPAA